MTAGFYLGRIEMYPVQADHDIRAAGQWLEIFGGHFRIRLGKLVLRTVVDVFPVRFELLAGLLTDSRAAGREQAESGENYRY